MIDHGRTILNAICNLLDQQLSHVGFMRRGRRLWWRTFDGITTLVGLEKSPWGHQYHLEVGFILRNVPGVFGKRVNASPKVHHAHVRLCGETLYPGWREVSAKDLPLNQWLDVEGELDRSVRLENIGRFVSERLMPLLTRCTTSEELVRMYRQGLLTAAIVHQNAIHYMTGE